MKRCSILYITRELQIKQYDTTICLLECPKSRTRTVTPNTAEDVDQEELPFTAGGSANGTAVLEDSLTVSYRSKCTLTI